MMGKVGGVGMKKSVFFLCAESERIPLLRSYFFRVQGWVERRGGRVKVQRKIRDWYGYSKVVQDHGTLA